VKTDPPLPPREDWIKAGDTAFQRSIVYSNTDWSILDFSLYHVFPAPFGGPVGMTTPFCDTYRISLGETC
jgi:hypothetical protein